MTTSKKPKLILFDLGGVCVLSPFQAILDYELSLGIPPGWVNYSISRTAPNGAWHRLETGAIPLDASFYAAFNDDLHDPSRWRTFCESQQAAKRPGTLPREIPPVPTMDCERLFNDMMAQSARPDPWIFPALRTLRRGGQFMLGALSNTVIFPAGHPLREAANWEPERDGEDCGGCGGGGGGGGGGRLKDMFDFVVSSAHVGVRKPDPRVYHLTVAEANAFAVAHADSERGRRLGWETGIKADEILFLDDIGENLKAARKEGFATIKVPLGRGYEAVDKLESVTGLNLAGNHPKIPLGRTRSEGLSKI